MYVLHDLYGRNIRLTGKRQQHIFTDHPEMTGQIKKLEETLKRPDAIMRSNSDSSVQLFYKNYLKTPVTNKFLCVVVKMKGSDAFVITSYFTESIKKGEVLWTKK